MAINRDSSRYRQTPTVDVEVHTQTSTASQGMKPRSKKGSAIGHIVMKPITWASNSFKWITNPTSKGGAQYVAKAMALACLGLSIENSYCLFSGADKKFLPKPGINDGAEISRILPLGNAGNTVWNGAISTVNLLGANVKHSEPFTKTDLIVWADPRFYFGLVLCLMVNSIQAMALRRVSLEMRARQLDESRQVDFKIAAITKSFEEQAEEYKRLETMTREVQVKHYGNGSILLAAAIVASSYIYEGATFFGNAAPGMNFAGTTLLALASIFGAEVFWFVGEQMETRDSED